MDKDFKPDWKDAPEWAQFVAMDSDGSWYWYGTKPVLNEKTGIWVTSDDSFLFVEKLKFTPIYEPRPSGQSPEQ